MFPKLWSQIFHSDQIGQVDGVVVSERFLEIKQLPDGYPVAVHVDGGVVSEKGGGR